MKKTMMMMAAALLATFLSNSAVWAVDPSRVLGLRCESRVEPVGIDVPQPRFHWIMEAAARGQAQSAYQILVSASQEALNRDEGDLWDSGRVVSSESVAIPYAGKPLLSCRQYWWKVRTWDQNGKVSSWSSIAGFVTGKLAPKDWQGDWIGTGLPATHGAVYLQRTFESTKLVTRALVCFSGLGFSELAINGKKVGDYVIGPGFTTYDQRVQYLAFDVTSHFTTPGSKTLDVTLVDGWYALSKDPWVHNFHKRPYVDRPKLLLNLHLQHPDGSDTVIVSDTNWRWSTGEITRSWIAEEDIDLRKSDRQWQPVAVVTGPKGQLVSQREFPNRIVEEVLPVKATYDPVKKSCLFDFGRQINGWVRLKAAGPRDTEIKVVAMPLVPDKKNGLVPFKRRTSRFVLAGTGTKEIYEPRFFHAGMQWVEVQGLSSEPAQGDLVGCAVSSMYTPSGHFRCSDELQTWLNDAVRRTVVMYTTFLPNDPVREWKAWMQDPQNMFVSAVYLFDSQVMYERWQYDMMDGQRADGNVPEVAPGNVFDAYNSPWWGGCAVWLPWHWYQYYGDPSLLKASYPAMKRYVDFLEKSANKDGLQDWGLMDWLPAEETPRPLVNTPAHFLFADIVSRTATMLGLSEEAKTYEAKAAAIRDNFNARFLDKATGMYGVSDPKSGKRRCTQASQVLPLALGMVPAENRAAVEAALLQNIVQRKGNVSTGFVATPYLLQVLADLDPEVGWKMTSAREFPSWYSMTRGANSDLLKETWAGGQALMPSLGGNIAGWHTEALGGIRPATPGFKKILIKPAVVGDLTWVECNFDSPYGRIVSNWKREGQELQMDVTIPPNTTATVYVPVTAKRGEGGPVASKPGGDGPTKDAAAVTESGKPATQAEGVKFVKMENGAAVYEVGSGVYRFRSQM